MCQIGSQFRIYTCQFQSAQASSSMDIHCNTLGNKKLSRLIMTFKKGKVKRGSTQYCSAR